MKSSSATSNWTAISGEQWERAVPYQDRDTLEALVEYEGASVSLSGVGLLFLDEVRTPSQLVPFLSRKAWEECLNLEKRKQCEPFRFLDRVARFPESRRLAEHKKAGHGLVWLKPGNTVDRYLVSEEGWRLLVWRAVGKDELGDDYMASASVDPERERSRYAPFTRMELYE